MDEAEAQRQAKIAEARQQLLQFRNSKKKKKEKKRKADDNQDAAEAPAVPAVVDPAPVEPLPRHRAATPEPPSTDSAFADDSQAVVSPDDGPGGSAAPAQTAGDEWLALPLPTPSATGHVTMRDPAATAAAAVLPQRWTADEPLVPPFPPLLSPAASPARSAGDAAVVQDLKRQLADALQDRQALADQMNQMLSSLQVVSQKKRRDDDDDDDDEKEEGKRRKCDAMFTALTLTPMKQGRLAGEMQRRQELESLAATRQQQHQEQLERLRQSRDLEAQQAAALSEELVNAQRDLKLALSQQQQHSLNTSTLGLEVQRLQHLLNARDIDLQAAREQLTQLRQDRHPDASANPFTQQQIDMMGAMLDDKEAEAADLQAQVEAHTDTIAKLELQVLQQAQQLKEAARAASSANAAPARPQPCERCRHAEKAVHELKLERDAVQQERHDALDALHELQEQHEALINASTSRGAMLRKNTAEMTNLRMKVRSMLPRE